MSKKLLNGIWVWYAYLLPNKEIQVPNQGRFTSSVWKKNYESWSIKQSMANGKNTQKIKNMYY